MISARYRLPPAALPAFDRRQFLKLAGATGLVLGLRLPGTASAQPGSPPPIEPTVFVRLSPDDWVTVVIKHHEMGQGATTGLATLVAEELDADWSRVRAEYAVADQKYANLFFGGQGTGGSTSIANSWEQLRRAGAAMRAMLVQSAADAWGVPAGEITVDTGVLRHGGRTARFGEFADAAAAQPVPHAVTLKAPADFKLIGRRDLHRLDSPAKSTGTAEYTIDVKLDGLLTAVIARPPTLGATVKSFDARAAKQVAGVTDVVQVPQGVAVVATGMWPALQGRRALKVEWADGPGADFSSEATLADYRRRAEAPGLPAHRADDTEERLADAASTLDVVFEFPYLAHAPMEPLNCVAWLHDGRLETFSAHQFQAIDHPLAAQTAGLPADRVTLHNRVSGGSFGRRANAGSDFMVEAIEVAKAIGGRAPVRVQRTREDDMHAQWYRPMYVHAARIGLDAQRRPVDWRHRIVGQSIIAPTPFAEMMIKNGIDESSTEGVAPTPYRLPAMSVELHSVEQPVKPLWWRSVGHTHTAYVMETLMDELAERAGEDPLAFRLGYLAQAPRMAAVLQRAADEADWGRTLPEGHAFGIAGHMSFSTYVAQVVDVSRGADGLPRVHRVSCAVDCGIAVNPDQIAAQMEGGIGFALAAALYGELDIENGRVKQSNFHDYKVLRMHEMPRVDVHIIASDAAPTGVGEPGVPPLAPAVANAWYRLTGERVRRLPFARAARSA